MNKTELLGNMNQGWHDFQRYLNTLSTNDFIGKTDAAGWTVKDHVMHLAVWEDGVWALLEGQSRHEQMGVEAEVWESHDFDEINAVIQQQHRDKPLSEVLETFRQVHQRLIGKVATLTDDDLQRPYEHYQPGSGVERPVFHWIVSNSYEHYAEHRPWIAAIVASSR